MIGIKGRAIGINRLYKGRRFLTKEGKEWKEILFWELKKQWKNGIIKGYVTVEIDFFYQDKRRRDIDGPVKNILDCMTGIVYEDDSQINKLIITKNTGADRMIIRAYASTI